MKHVCLCLLILLSIAWIAYPEWARRRMQEAECALDYPGTIRWSSHVLTLRPGDAAARRARLDAKHEMNDLVGALADAERLVRILPRDPEARYMRGWLRQRIALGDETMTPDIEDRVLEDMSFYLAARPRGDMIVYAAGAVESIHVRRGKEAVREGWLDHAMNEFRRAMAFGRDPRATTARALVWRARARFGLGDAPGAEGDYREAFLLDPDGALELAANYDDIEHNDADLFGLEAWMAAQPGSDRLRHVAADRYAIAGDECEDPERAIAYLDRALGLDPTSWEAHRSRQACRSALGWRFGAFLDAITYSGGRRVAKSLLQASAFESIRWKWWTPASRVGE